MTPADLRAILKALGMSQLRLAEVLGVNPGTVRRWLHLNPKKATPIPPLVARVVRAAALGKINLDDLEGSA